MAEQYLFFSFPVKAELQESVGGLAADAFTELKHVLLPVTDRNPYLSEGTRQVSMSKSNCIYSFVTHSARVIKMSTVI